MAIAIFIIGLFIGSFLGVVIKRFEKPKSIISQPSRCDQCKKKLGVLDLVPVLSFIFSQGRCRYCQKPLGWFYPVIELVTALVLSLSWYFLTQQGEKPITIMLYSIIVLTLVVIAGIDLEKMTVPDTLVILIVLLALLNLISGENYLAAVYGALAGGGFLGLLALAGQGKWMGWGDVKLMGALGLWLGLDLTISALFLAFVSGALISLILLAIKAKKLKDHLPFTPFLVLGSLLAVWLNFSVIDRLVFW